MAFTNDEHVSKQIIAIDETSIFYHKFKRSM